MHFPCQHSALYKAICHCNCLAGEIEDAIYPSWYGGMGYGTDHQIYHGLCHQGHMLTVDTLIQGDLVLDHLPTTIVISTGHCQGCHNVLFVL